MTLPAASRFGPYEIVAPLGAGGMGEVYRATDTKLGREVAIKVLPAEVAGDAERLARFEREAKLLASLNHPNIAHVYGFESATLQDGSTTHFLAMELVEGEDLSERLKRGPIPVEEALEIAKQIAEALEEAHERGIVHRDLKPANVKLTPDGKVKVLDFGLAKAYAGEGAGGPSPDLSQSPTLAHAGTQAGLILGTAAYMSPEQARGKPVDKRADIWAFGVVLWEMLTGRQLFAGETVSDVLAAVLTREPDASTLPPQTPAAIRQLLRRCLERNPKNRLHDSADARIAIDDVLAGDAAEELPASSPGLGSQRVKGWRRALPWALLALVAAAWLATLLSTRDEATGPATTVLPLDLGDDPIVMSYGASAVLSPDGRRLAWIGGRQNDSWIMVRDLDSAEPRRLDGTEGAHDPVFSPDGQELAYFAATTLKRVPVRGGAPQPLAEVGLPRGVTWSDDGFVIYNRDVADGLWRVPAGGGTPERLTAPDEKGGERSHRWPRFVPGSRRVLFLAQKLGQRYEEATIEMLDLDSRARTVVHRGGSYPRLTAHGELLYARDKALWAATLDLKGGRLTSAPVRVLDEVAYSDWSGGAQFDVADDGSLVYSTGRSDEAVQLSWYDLKTGSFEGVAGEAGYYYTPALAPDGHSLALQVYTGGRSDIWVFDLGNGSRRRLTFSGRDQYPVWSPDGASIAFARIEEGTGMRLARIRADGVGEPVAFAADANGRFPTSWSAGGELLVTESSPETHADIWVAWPEQPKRSPEPFLRTPANEGHASFSPDGRWVLYQSDESGTDEIYVRAFSGAGGRWQVSEGGGAQPRWSPDGRSVFYWSRAGLCRREVQLEGKAFVLGRVSVFAVEKPVLRTEESGYVVGRDGRLLLCLFAGEGKGRPRTHLVLGWGRELQRRVVREE
jgi:Tol biopolymer transport system component